MIDWSTTVIGPLMGVFGEAVTYRPYAGTPYPITGVFDDAYLKEVMFEDASQGVTDISAVLGVQLSQFPSPPLQNDSLSVASINTTFVVREVRTDSHGGGKLMLSKVSSP
ncbi:head-tail joining protein [Paraburkholderia atlantica]|uniref:head-tail joining protein n=1 Tax=Paraburkholderia atlantica TaxID=2654982 RepID=UPI001611829A|nr:hypothetical protein [Paraburkholderia atlantica]MBB5414104.1 hypothetical protein [Paraburkholderia atlantica]